VAGHAFHAGVLLALADACGWDARQSALIVGTSAGAQVGALLRAGVSPASLYARVTTDPLAFAGVTAARAPAPQAREPRRWPASPAYLGRVLRRPWRARPGRVVAALLPERDRPNDLFRRAHARLFDDRWPARPLWIAALDLDRGTRVVFGRAGAPRVDVPTAVCCSSAVPGLVRPVRLAGRRYIDGAIASPTHLDLLLAPEAGAALAIVLSPLSRFAALRLWLRLELARVIRRGARLVLFEPGREVAAAMGWNPLDARVAPLVARAAYGETLRCLAAPRAGALRALLSAAPRMTRTTSATTSPTS
jgi:NTE family protein